MDQKTQAMMASLHGLLPLLLANALNVLGAVVILLVGLWLAGKADLLTVRALGRTPHFDAMLKSFFGSMVRYLVLTVTVLAVLSQFGIQTASLVAVVGAAGLAVGLALQGTLSHLAAGVMLLIFRPFRIGQKVQVGGSTGTVRQLALFWTELVTDDQVQVIVPNGGVWGQPLRNYSAYPAPSPVTELRCRLPETTPLDTALAQVRTILEAEPRVHKDPPPRVLLDRGGADYALELVIAFTVSESETAAVKSDLIKRIQEEVLDRRPQNG